MAVRWNCGCQVYQQGKKLRWDTCGDFHPTEVMVSVAEEIAGDGRHNLAPPSEEPEPSPSHRREAFAGASGLTWRSRDDPPEPEPPRPPKAKANLPPRPCRVCGKPFIPYKSDQTLCSKPCRKAAQAERERRRYAAQKEAHSGPQAAAVAGSRGR